MTPASPYSFRRLTVSHLCGARGERTLFSDLDFAVEPGRILLLRGPNGAGKTSLLMMLAGIVRPMEGKIVLEGSDPERQAGIDIAFFGHRPAVKARLSVAENLRFWGALYGSGEPAIAQALERVGLAEIGRLDAGYLSAGQTRRLALARLLIAERAVWLLDEPLSALDGEGERIGAALIDAHLDRGGLAVAAVHHDLALDRTERIDTLTLGGRQ